MKTAERAEPQEKRKNLKLILISLGVGFVLLAIISLIRFDTLLFFIPFWFWCVNKIVSFTGINIWLVRGFVALLAIPFFYAIRLMFSGKVQRRIAGKFLLSVLAAFLCFAMFFLSDDIYFSFKTGQANKWYIITPEGEYKFSDSLGYDTFWGIQYQEVTTQTMTRYYELRKEVRKYFRLPKEQYFDPKTGKAVKWYAELPNGTVEFLPHSRFHPKYGTILKPVTPELIWDLEKKKLKKEEREVELKKKLESPVSKAKIPDKSDEKIRKSSKRESKESLERQKVKRANKQHRVPASKVKTLVTVSANHPFWIETGIFLNPGDIIRIEAAGKILWEPAASSFGQDWVGPEGAGWRPKDVILPGEFPLPDFPIASLICQIGLEIYGIGKNREIKVKRGGTLKLGINERWLEHSFNDNKGNFTVSLTKYPSQPSFK